MPIEDSSIQYINKLVLVWPIIGFGWSRVDPNVPPDQPGVSIEPPPLFHARVLELHKFAGKIAGGVGTVEEPNHLLDKEWVAFCVRDRGADMYNLTTNPGKYNLEIGKNKPSIRIDIEVPMPQWMRFEGSLIVSGFGFIAESETWLKDKPGWLK
jgi:hypothetical protein